MSDSKIEFAVQLSGPKCAEKVKEALRDVGDVVIDLELGRVVVNTSRPWSEIKERIEQTGRRAVLSGFGGILCLSVTQGGYIFSNSGQSAVAIINDDLNNIKGVVRFSKTEQSSGCIVDGVVDGLTPGLHGIHVYECGDLSQGCDSIGGHYNPRGSPHGAPDNPPNARHAGDLGNILAEENGRAQFRFIDPVLEVWDIIGRSVAVSENPDDLGRGGRKKSPIDGNTGRRLACGIIARSAGIYQNYKRICACDGVTIWDERDKPLAGGDRKQSGKL